MPCLVQHSLHPLAPLVRLQHHQNCDTETQNHQPQRLLPQKTILVIQKFKVPRNEDASQKYT